MKRLTIAIGTVVLAGGAAIWGCGSNSTSPTNAPVVYTVNLLASNETTLASQAEINGKGTAVITVHPTRDGAGNVTGGTIDFSVSLSGFPNGSSAILSHIHGPNAPAGVAAGIFIDTGLNAGTAIQMPNGSATYSFTSVSPTDQTKIAQVLANPSQFYFNVHTPVNPAGAVRGQLQ
jgi:hypothetical protein